jgi:hypothetical protein
MTRRDALRRAAAVGGTLAWTVPAVQSMSGSAVAAAGSLAVEGTKSGQQPEARGAAETGLLGSRLPGTGSMAADVAALGVGALAVGAALRSVRKRPTDSDGTAETPTGE